jgi:hypothetical protein
MNMNEFFERLGRIDRHELKSFLTQLTDPCYETDLWKLAFPADPINSQNPLLLYQNHFLLFHTLYLLQDEFYQEGKYLHIHFMRIRIVEYPKPGFCSFFNDMTLEFCSAQTIGKIGFCQYHASGRDDGDLEELSARYFYLDSKNFSRLDETSAGVFINGYWEILNNYQSIKESFQVLDLPENSDLNLIKKKFRSLAKRFHPDKTSQPQEDFIRINNAYQILSRFLTLNKLPNSEKK